jgi:hypothetical protein
MRNLKRGLRNAERGTEGEGFVQASLDRREFLGALGMAGAALARGRDEASATQRSAAPVGLFAAPPIDVVRIGFVGVGHQGTSHVENFLKIDGVDIRAVCDIVPAKGDRIREVVTAAGRPTPVGYSRGPDDFRRMCAEEELDLVFTATPWEWHAPVCKAAMEHGKHAATEVPMGVTLDECWELVELAEKTRRHCVMMENCCYDRTEMMILNMVRQGLFGELLHAECGYLHDLRELKLTDFYEGNWRVRYSIRRNGDRIRRTAWVRGAMARRESRQPVRPPGVDGVQRTGPHFVGGGALRRDSPAARETYALGDVISTLIRTAAGQTILIIVHDQLAAPVQPQDPAAGHRGLVRKYPEEKIHVAGLQRAAPGRISAYRAEFEHPVWRALEERSRGAGHGGMDFIEDYRLVECLRAGQPLDLDVYDGAAWSAVSALSERSIRQRSRSVDCPDFTRRARRTRPPLGIVEPSDVRPDRGVGRLSPRTRGAGRRRGADRAVRRRAEGGTTPRRE